MHFVLPFTLLSVTWLCLLSSGERTSCVLPFLFVPYSASKVSEKPTFRIDLIVQTLKFNHDFNHQEMKHKNQLECGFHQSVCQAPLYAFSVPSPSVLPPQKLNQEHQRIKEQLEKESSSISISISVGLFPQTTSFFHTYQIRNYTQTKRNLKSSHKKLDDYHMRGRKG